MTSNESLCDKRLQLLVPYCPPVFFQAALGANVAAVPTHTIALSTLPTPIQRWSLPELPEDVVIDVKRDDMTGGVEATGNKVRKLDFILADAVLKRCTAVVTAGGTQSNHARATAACCARLFSLPCHLLLRKDSPGRNGNFLLSSLLGARITEVERQQVAEWKAAFGEETWVEGLTDSQMPPGAYAIPVGGSNTLGCWGYLSCVNELVQQSEPAGGLAARYSDIVVCSGSGGTVAGLATGLDFYRRSAAGASMHAVVLRSYCVCDSPDYFYDAIQRITAPLYTAGRAPPSRSLVSIEDAKGEGYAKSTQAELQFLSRVARETGLVLDPCYTGKTVHRMWEDLKNRSCWSGVTGRRVLYVHTGGGPSVFDREQDLLPLMSR